MEHPGFFDRSPPVKLADLVRATGSQLHDASEANREIVDVQSLSDAGPQHVSFLDNKKYLPQLATTSAGASFVLEAYKDVVPSTCLALTAPAPYRCFALALQLFYPQAAAPKIADAGPDVPPIDPTAELEDGVEIEPGVIVGPQARIGSGTRLAAGCVIGARVHIGRNSYIGASATVAHALVGDGVTIHTGVRIGQDGFGFAMGPEGHVKVPQIGRVIIQNNVELGANTAVDRGALNDTIIGEGTKIDNLVQIGHNVVIGRHCVIAGQAGVAGSSELGDFVIVGGDSGIAGHLKIGSGAHIAGASHPKKDVPPGASVGGTPARPLRQWAKELAILGRLAKK